MKFSFAEGARRLKDRLSNYCFSSRDRPCAECMKLFLSLFKICGLFVNEINKGRLKRCSRPFYGIGAFWIIVYVSYMCFLLYNYVTADRITIRITMDFLKYLVGYVNLIVNIIIAYTSQNHFAKFFDRMDSYDYEVARMNNERRDNLWIPWLVTFLMMIIILLLMSTMMFEISQGALFFIRLSNIFITIMHMYGTLEKFLMLHLLLERFKHINNKIAPNVTWDEKRQRGPRTITVPNFKMLHSMLHDAQRTFNSIYENSLLMWFAFLMIQVLSSIRFFRQKALVIACIFVGSTLIQLLILCTICHYTAEEANRIPCVLCEYMNSLVHSGNTMIKIDILTYFLHKRVSFEAAGFFTINLPLFQSIVATITTYFIILI